jgi:MFS family permease
MIGFHISIDCALIHNCQDYLAFINYAYVVRLKIRLENIGTFWQIISGKKLRKLLLVRWSGQLTDGLFQAALASYVLFSPERQPNATAAATAFATVLLPYSIVAPFAGVILDRFSRRQIIKNSNLVRAFFLIAVVIVLQNNLSNFLLVIFVLCVFGANRLILAGLSAALPLTLQPNTKKEQLISANAIAVTGGTIFVVIGGGLGIGTKKLLDMFFSSDNLDSLLIAIAIFGYLSSAFLVNRFAKHEIGPLENEINNSNKLSEIKEGFIVLREHSDIIRAIFAVALQRSSLTALTLMALLLERNTFNDPTQPDTGLTSFGFALAIAGIGVGIGAVVAPYGVSRFGRHKFIRIMLFLCVIALFNFAISITEINLIISAFFLGLFGQAIKVTTDALAQSRVNDDFRGRVFAFYDVVVNFGIVCGALIAALLLPTSGLTKSLPIFFAVLLLIYNLTNLRKLKFLADSNSTN